MHKQKALANGVTRITTLVEDTVNRRGLLAEHGLAFHIQSGEHSVLFDTGQTGLVVYNARRLGIALEEVEWIVLSHGHYDHVGGVGAVLRIARRAKVIVHPDALLPKYGRSPGGVPRALGFGEPQLRVLRQLGDRLIQTRASVPVAERMYVTGEIDRAFSDGEGESGFFRDGDCREPDPLWDDQALFIDLEDGIVVLLGCAHAGVVNTLACVERLTGGKRVLAVLGGLHLHSADQERIDEVIDLLRRLKPEVILPAHCTGSLATARLWTAFPEACYATGVGTEFEFMS